MTGLAKWTPLFTLALGLCIAGCATFIGAGIGLLVDSGTPDSVEVAKSELKSVPQGERLSLHLDDLSRGYGRYRGQDDVAAEDYTTFYESRRKDLASQIPLPTLGDSVTVAVHDRQSIRGQFIGFSEGCITLKTVDRVNPENLKLYSSFSIETQDGNRIAATDLQELFVKKMIPTTEKIPTTTGVSLQTKFGTKVYPMDRIKAMWVVHPNNAWIHGAIIGATVDLVAAAVLTVILRNHPLFHNGGMGP